MKISIPMRRFNIAYTIGCVAVIAASLQGCIPKSGAIVSPNAIIKPYSMHYSDSSGQIYATNDGEAVHPVAGTDKSPLEALGTIGDRILMVKTSKAFLFADDAGEGDVRNFNPVYGDLNPSAFGNTMFLSLPNYNDTGAITRNRLYVASSKGTGLEYTDDDYVSPSDSDWKWFPVPEPGLSTSSITSLTKLSDGSVVAFDDASRKIFVKPNLTTGFSPATSSGLPASGSGRMYIMHQNNDILAIQIDGPAGSNNIWRSTDRGNSFTKLPDLPYDDMTCAIAAFDKVIVVGTRSNGVVRFSAQNAWDTISSNNGLKNGTQINAITYKTNKFKNKKEGEYIYIATNTGIYRSDDYGQSWTGLDPDETYFNNYTNIE